MIIPESLRPGDRVALVCPASPASEKERSNAERNIRGLGLEPVFFPSCYAEHGFLAGRDEVRTADFMNAFQDPEIKAVISMKGGYGCARLLTRLDYDIIRRNPKHFLGFSDISVLHAAINQTCGQMTIHGCMPGVKWERSGETIFKSTGDILFGFPEGSLANPEGEAFTCIVPGRASGLTCGGNLSRLVSTLGSPYEIDTRDKLIFIEEIGERAEDVDLMLMSLALAGKFRDCAGIILGTFIDCQETESERPLSLQEISDEVLKPWNKPVIGNLCSGHGFPFVSFPLGAWAEIDAEAGCISFSREKTEKA